MHLQWHSQHRQWCLLKVLKVEEEYNNLRRRGRGQEQEKEEDGEDEKKKKVLIYFTKVVFTELTPLGRFIHTIAMSVCLSVFLSVCDNSKHSLPELWSKDVLLILARNDTLLLLFILLQ